MLPRDVWLLIVDVLRRINRAPSTNAYYRSWQSPAVDSEEFGPRPLYRVCRYLADLRFSNVCLLSPRKSDASPKALYQILRQRTLGSEVTLSLTTWPWQERSEDVLGAALPKQSEERSSAVVALVLSTTGSRLREARDLAAALDCNVTLRSIDLYYNMLGPAGARVLCDAIAVHRSMRELDLSENGAVIDRVCSASLLIISVPS